MDESYILDRNVLHIQRPTCPINLWRRLHKRRGDSAEARERAEEIAGHRHSVRLTGAVADVLLAVHLRRQYYLYVISVFSIQSTRRRPAMPAVVEAQGFCLLDDRGRSILTTIELRKRWGKREELITNRKK